MIIAQISGIAATVLLQGVYSGIIGAIGSVTVNTCKTIKSIYEHKNDEVQQILIKLDLERKLKVIQAVLNKINANETQKEESIEISIIYIKKTVCDINTALDEINKKITDHNNKWFYSYRKLNLSKQMEQLKIHSNLLDERFRDLVCLFDIMN